ncbi:MAG: copper resistance CopC family protein [Rhodoglobus sp.]
MTTNASRRLALIAVGALVVAVPVLGLSAPAQAHNYIVSSTPASGETLTELPESFSITTNGPLLTLGGSTSGFAFEIRDSTGNFYGDGCVTVTGASMTTAATLGSPGDYSVIWQLVSTDGHTVSGEYPFTWAPASGQVQGTGSKTAPDCKGTAGGNAPNPEPTDAGDRRESKADLGDVLWIGGAIGAVLVAGLTTFVILGRRPKP